MLHHNYERQNEKELTTMDNCLEIQVKKIFIVMLYRLRLRALEYV